ncbi:SET domain [Macleaya cordata]|uniref:N-lysine methyltransferase n=1 Tax=Macleaya cordata TaxID=56857 RepID=A0A200RE37_MACCD|nr:SET domain [Macleaya cordata]
MTRRLRAFKRWMRSQGIDCSDGLELIDNGNDEGGIFVKAVCDLNEGDLVATIPKNACLTIKTSAAREMIEESGLAESLGLAVALMYEKSLGEDSNWAGYLQLLPDRECVPWVWTLDEVDELLSGTELHKTVKEDKTLIYEDWKENILPLLASGSLDLDPKSFAVEQYFAARSLVASRSFEIDDYHGYGMVPLADLFNHKTGAENVHFTSSSPHSGSDNENDIEDIEDEFHDNSYDKPSIEDVHSGMNGSPTALVRNDYLNGNTVDYSSDSGDEPTALEMIVVKGVKAGDEVFNTYGTMGNAALLHRYGFTEPDNYFDIVNIDLKVVTNWSSSLFSNRYSRVRLSLWRRLGCSGCVDQTSEYFEISSNGEPQLELLILLYIIFLPEEAYHKLNHSVPSVEDINEAISILLLEDNKNKRVPLETAEMAKDLLLTERVCGALVSLANIRESIYGLKSVDDDIEALGRCSCVKERKLYHSLVLRVSERRILERLRTYASKPSCRPKKRSCEEKLKRIKRSCCESNR